MKVPITISFELETLQKLKVLQEEKKISSISNFVNEIITKELVDNKQLTTNKKKGQ